MGKSFLHKLSLLFFSNCNLCVSAESYESEKLFFLIISTSPDNKTLSIHVRICMTWAMLKNHPKMFSRKIFGDKMRHHQHTNMHYTYNAMSSGDLSAKCMHKIFRLLFYSSIVRVSVRESSIEKKTAHRD